MGNAEATRRTQFCPSGTRIALPRLAKEADATAGGPREHRLGVEGRCVVAGRRECR